MQPPVFLKRTTTNDTDFLLLVAELDFELWNELAEDQATYEQFNKVPAIVTAVVLYEAEVPAACGCFKEIDAETVEVKRMFVRKPFRGKGHSKTILQELEKWAISLGYRIALLETSIHFAIAKSLYQRMGYALIPNYPPYTDLPESVCMKKELK